MYSQQLSVEDPDDTGTLQAVGGSATLTSLEGCRQLLDLIPLTSVLQRKHRISLTFATEHLLLRSNGKMRKKKSLVFTLVGSKLAWTAGLGHLPNLKTWALAARTDSRVKEITCRVFIFITCGEQNRRHVGTISFTSGGCSWTQCRRPHFWQLTTEGKSRRHVQMWRGRAMAAVCSPVCVRDIHFWGSFIHRRTCSFIIDHIL